MIHEHYSVTQGQVNVLQAFSLQLKVIFMQHFYSVTPVHCIGNYSATIN